MAFATQAGYIILIITIVLEVINYAQNQQVDRPFVTCLLGLITMYMGVTTVRYILNN